jgi:hypothetical protein
MPELTRESLIEAAKAAAGKAGPDLSRADFVRVTGITDHQIARLFPEGRWSEVKRLAGLDRHPKHNSPLDDETILREFHRVASELGQIPTWALFAHKANISADVVRRRFGGLQGTLTAYRDWLEKTEPASPLLEQLHVNSRHEIPTPPVAVDNVKSPASPSWVKIDGPVWVHQSTFAACGMLPLTSKESYSFLGWSLTNSVSLSRQSMQRFPTVKQSAALTQRTSDGNG